jgi:FkbM family methyltransferase
MIECGGVYLPDGETHLVEWMRNDKHAREVDDKLTYQYHKLEAALGYVRNWRTAVDVGSHCGLWAMHLVKKFAYVHAFEPVASHRGCYLANVHGDNSYLHPCALGAEKKYVGIHTAPTSSGDSWVIPEGDIEMRCLDEFALDDVDFIKLDTEGHELLALRGGEETLKRCKPCVIVEQKKGHAQRFGLPETGAVDYLLSLGAKLRLTISGDYVLSWDA